MDSGDLLHESRPSQDEPRDKDNGNSVESPNRFELPNDDDPTICGQVNDRERESHLPEASSDLKPKESSHRDDHRESSIKVGKRDRSHSSSKTSFCGNESPPMLAPNMKLSSVLANPIPLNKDITANEIKRKAVLESQRNDKQAFDRNKRMFGMLMGTLQQFRTEEHGRERLTIKRSKIEEKLELADQEERASTNIATNKVTRPNSERLLPEIKPSKDEKPCSDKADLKLDITNRFKRWESTHRDYYNFIQTEAKPKIFWFPKEHTPTTEKKLRETKDYISLCIAERAAKLKKELGELDVNSKTTTKREQKPDPQGRFDEKLDE